MSSLKKLKAASSLNDLAEILGYKPSALSFLLYKFDPNQRYTSFDLPKKDGGVRVIDAPTGRFKRLQKHVANLLYDCSAEIERENARGSLSHGFRYGHSIVTNARQHRNRRYVLNLDLADFFPTFNFGRVRGYFLKNKHFELNENVATVIAQIACYQKGLPQGSPCSPVIADLIARILDLRLARLSKPLTCTYSRYADDLTFSTNRQDFPSDLAVQAPDGAWQLGLPLLKEIEKAGFAVNYSKTRVQYRGSRQMVTGLVVNKTVNIRAEYYRYARSMCHSLFRTGKFYVPEGLQKVAEAEAGGSLRQLEGILNHVHYVKDLADYRDTSEKKKTQLAIRKLYKKFLFYKHFIALTKPLLVCEGPTDATYIKLAIQHLAFDRLASFNTRPAKWSVDFFKYAAFTQEIMQLGGGTGGIKKLLLDFHDTKKGIVVQPSAPVIIVIDNDDGAPPVFAIAKEKFGIPASLTTKASFYKLDFGLYLVKTPEAGAKGSSCIENFFDQDLLKQEVNGKKFNPDKMHEAEGEYGKTVFAEKVIRANAHKINFSGFAPILERIVAAIDDHKSAL